MRAGYDNGGRQGAICMKPIERILVVIDAEVDYSAAPDGLPIELRKALRFAMDQANTEIKLLSVGYEKYLSHSF